MFRCDRRCDGCDGKFGNLVGTKHTRGACSTVYEYCGRRMPVYDGYWCARSGRLDFGVRVRRPPTWECPLSCKNEGRPAPAVTLGHSSRSRPLGPRGQSRVSPLRLGWLLWPYRPACPGPPSYKRTAATRGRCASRCLPACPEFLCSSQQRNERACRVEEEERRTAQAA